MEEDRKKEKGKHGRKDIYTKIIAIKTGNGVSEGRASHHGTGHELVTPSDFSRSKGLHGSEVVDQNGGPLTLIRVK